MIDNHDFVKIEKIFEIQNQFQNDQNNARSQFIDVFSRQSFDDAFDNFDTFQLFNFVEKIRQMKIEMILLREKKNFVELKRDNAIKNVKIVKFENVDISKTRFKFKFVKFEKMRFYNDRNENEH